MTGSGTNLGVYSLLGPAAKFDDAENWPQQQQQAMVLPNVVEHTGGSCWSAAPNLSQSELGDVFRVREESRARERTTNADLTSLGLGATRVKTAPRPSSYCSSSSSDGLEPTARGRTPTPTSSSALRTSSSPSWMPWTKRTDGVFWTICVGAIFCWIGV